MDPSQRCDFARPLSQHRAPCRGALDGLLNQDTKLKKNDAKRSCHIARASALYFPRLALLPHGYLQRMISRKIPQKTAISVTLRH